MGERAETEALWGARIDWCLQQEFQLVLLGVSLVSKGCVEAFLPPLFSFVLHLPSQQLYCDFHLPFVQP